VNIETKQITTLCITDVQGLDPVTVFLENYEPGRGKITIECYGESWSSFWGAMSVDTVETFFRRCDEHYLAKNLSSVAADVFDEDAARKMVTKSIIELRKNKEINHCEARHAVWQIESHETMDHYIYCSNDVTKHVIGAEPWHMDWPTKPNPKYVYLCLIIKTVQKALNTAFNTENGAAS
jgi:hypothetical protein